MLYKNQCRFHFARRNPNPLYYNGSHRKNETLTGFCRTTCLCPPVAKVRFSLEQSNQDGKFTVDEAIKTAQRKRHSGAINLKCQAC